MSQSAKQPMVAGFLVGAPLPSPAPAPSPALNGARQGSSRPLPPSMKAYILRRLMRRNDLALAITTAREFVEAERPMPKEVFESLLIEAHRMCDWYASDRVELLRLAKGLAEQRGIPVLRHPLHGRQDSFVVSFGLPQGVVGWHLSAAQSDGLGCQEGPALQLTSQTPEHLAFRHERIDAFVG